MSEAGEAEVLVRYQGVEKRIVGKADIVIREMLSFFSQIAPQLDLISKISLNVDAATFIESCQGLFAVTPEGVIVTADWQSLTDKEAILLHLSRARIGYLTSKSEKDTQVVSDLVSVMRRSVGTLAGRLSELCSEQLVERVEKGEYKITTYGMEFFTRNIVPRLKTMSEAHPR